MQSKSDPAYRGKAHSQLNLGIRSVDRILTKSYRNGDTSAMSYKDRGLLLSEIHVLRQLGQSVLPGVARRDFLQDLDDLADVRTGTANQLRIVDRIRWSYGKYIN